VVRRREKTGPIRLTRGQATGQNQVTQRTRLFYLTMALVLGGILLASRSVEPSRLPNMCLLDMLVGLPCITSGLTRAFHAISWGQLRTGVVHHPLSLLLYGLTVFHLLVACLRLMGWKSRLIRIRNPVQVMVWGTIGVLFVVWIPRVLAMVLTQ
jgi:hypothetical protein